MSHLTERDFIVIRSERGYTPMILFQTPRECEHDMTASRAKQNTFWQPLFRLVGATKDEVIRRTKQEFNAGESSPDGEHWVKNGKCLTDDAMLRSVVRGVKNAVTFEEILSVNCNLSLCVKDENALVPFISLNNTKELDAFIDDLRSNSNKDAEHLCFSNNLQPRSRCFNATPIHHPKKLDADAFYFAAAKSSKEMWYITDIQTHKEPDGALTVVSHSIGRKTARPLCFSAEQVMQMCRALNNRNYKKIGPFFPVDAASFCEAKDSKQAFVIMGCRLNSKKEVFYLRNITNCGVPYGYVANWGDASKAKRYKTEEMAEKDALKLKAKFSGVAISVVFAN